MAATALKPSTVLETLRTTSIEGIETNLGFLRRVVSHPAFRAGEHRTDFVDRNRKDLLG